MNKMRLQTIAWFIICFIMFIVVIVTIKANNDSDDIILQQSELIDKISSEKTELQEENQKTIDALKADKVKQQTEIELLEKEVKELQSLIGKQLKTEVHLEESDNDDSILVPKDELSLDGRIRTNLKMAKKYCIRLNHEDSDANILAISSDVFAGKMTFVDPKKKKTKVKANDDHEIQLKFSGKGIYYLKFKIEKKKCYLAFKW